MFAHRQLKRKSPNRQKIEELFAEISDEVLLGAIANPDHSDEARRILKELAERRGLQVGGDLWDLSESSLNVKPFGRRPTFDEALAAPRKRRRLYRAMQAVVVVSLALGIAALWDSEETYEQWVTQGVADGALDGELIEGLNEGGARLRSDLRAEPGVRALRGAAEIDLLRDGHRGSRRARGVGWRRGGRASQLRPVGRADHRLGRCNDRSACRPGDGREGASVGSKI